MAVVTILRNAWLINPNVCSVQIMECKLHLKVSSKKQPSGKLATSITLKVFFLKKLR